MLHHTGDVVLPGTLGGDMGEIADNSHCLVWVVEDGLAWLFQ